jgi:hypothetical protein
MFYFIYLCVRTEHWIVNIELTDYFRMEFAAPVGLICSDNGEGGKWLLKTTSGVEISEKVSNQRQFVLTFFTNVNTNCLWLDTFSEISTDFSFGHCFVCPSTIYVSDFSFGHCFVCPSTIYGFWFLFWSLFCLFFFWPLFCLVFFWPLLCLSLCW